MGKHFRLEYVSEKTGEPVKDPETSFCGELPAVEFDPHQVEPDYWCSDCMAEFNKQAFGAISDVMGKMKEAGL